MVSRIRANPSFPAARTIRLDKRAGAVCRAAFGVPLDDAPTGCVSRARRSLTRNVCERPCRRNLLRCPGWGLRSSARASPRLKSRCFASSVRTACTYSRVQPENGLKQILEAVALEPRRIPLPHGHWYIDGGQEAAHDAALTCVSYHALGAGACSLVEQNTRGDRTARHGTGDAANAAGADTSSGSWCGQGRLDSNGSRSGVLDRFQVKLLTEGSGTQIFSTTFAQWAAREALRRAQPLTLLVRFAPRQRQKPMNEMLSAGADSRVELDPMGSLVDADMGAYYNWLNQQRLTRSRAVFVSGMVREP